jgi:hypothetical protein
MRARLHSTLPILFAAALWLGLTRTPPPSAGQAANDQPTKSALESEPQGWKDILPPKDLQGWHRVPVPAGSKLSTKNPWRVDETRRVLVCDGVGVHENLQYQRQLANFIFHVEWRFEPVEGKKGYNSGVYVRNSPDGAVWHQAQVGDRNVGFIFGDTLVGGKKMRFRVGETKPQRGKPPGEWNVYEITCRGKEVILWINGYVTAHWKECEVPSGEIGLEAEGWYIEFRNLQLKELP